MEKNLHGPTTGASSRASVPNVERQSKVAMGPSTNPGQRSQTVSAEWCIRDSALISLHFISLPTSPIHTVVGRGRGAKVEGQGVGG